MGINKKTLLLNNKTNTYQIMEIDKKLKTEWLAALKSGKYIQGVGKFKKEVLNETHHCCLGVLCEVANKSALSTSGVGNWTDVKEILNSSGSDKKFEELYFTNDEKCDGKYTAVIPLIELIPETLQS